MLTAGGSGTSRICRLLDALSPQEAIVSEIRTEAPEMSFEGIEKRKGLLSTHPVVIASEGNDVLFQGASHVVHQLVAGLAVELGVSAIDSGSENVGELQVRL